MESPNRLFNPYNLEVVRALPAPQRAEVFRHQEDLWYQAALFSSAHQRDRFVANPPQDPIASPVGRIVNELAQTDRQIARGHGFPGVTPEYASVVVDLAQAVEWNMRPKAPMPKNIHIGRSAIALAGIHLGLLGAPELLDDQATQMAVLRAADSYKKQVIMGIPAMPPRLRRP